jgi:hypothetical protein
VREAATALLRQRIDCSRELGPRYGDILQAHVDIIDGRWDAVGQVGPEALPALFRAARSGAYVLAQGARTLLRQMLPPLVPTLTRALPGSSETPSEAMGRVLTTALTRPAALRRSDSTSISAALTPDGGGDLPHLAVSALAAFHYSRPDLAESPLAARLLDLAAAPASPDDVAGAAARLLEHLGSSAVADALWPRLRAALSSDQTGTRTRDRLLNVAAEWTAWREDLVDLDDLLDLAALPACRLWNEIARSCSTT